MVPVNRALTQMSVLSDSMSRPGRWRRSGATAVLAATVLLLATAACSAPAAKPGAASSTGASSSTSASTSTTATAPVTAPVVVPTTLLPAAHVGNLVSIPAVDTSPSVQATLVKFIDPATAAGQNAAPVDGDRYVAVQLQVAFSGGTPPQEDFNGDTSVEDSQGTFYSSSDIALANCPAFANSNTSAVATGCVTFEVASNTTITDVTFTPSGDFGNVSAEWDVP
jgi:hypothetical protein